MNPKPFLKWAGGKSQLLLKFQELYPQQLKTNTIKHYYEPFLGSAAVFFDVKKKYDIQDAFLYDNNEELILIYQVIQRNIDKLLEFLKRYKLEYLALNESKRRKYFYEQRLNYNLQRSNIDFNKYSENWTPRAAQAIFLNKTCYNGLFRFNSKGEFNTPAGDYENPKIFDEENLLAVNKALKIAEIKKADFTEVANDLKSNSFIYLDPPYRPISRTSSFTSYSKHGFADSEQIRLANLFKELDEQKAKLMLSNSDPKNTDPSDNFFENLYANYNITRVTASRMVNSNSSKRGPVNELVIRNYN